MVLISRNCKVLVTRIACKTAEVTTDRPRKLDGRMNYVA